MVRQAQNYFAAAVSAAVLNAAAVTAFVLLTVLPSLHSWSLPGLIGVGQRVSANPSASAAATHASPAADRLQSRAHRGSNSGAADPAAGAAAQDPRQSRSGLDPDPSGGAAGHSGHGGAPSSDPAAGTPGSPTSTTAPDANQPLSQTPVSHSSGPIGGLGSGLSDTVGSVGSSGSGSGSNDSSSSGGGDGVVSQVTGTVSDTTDTITGTTDKILPSGKKGGGTLDGVSNTLGLG